MLFEPGPPFVHDVVLAVHGSLIGMGGIAGQRVEVVVERDEPSRELDGAAEGLGLIQHVRGLGRRMRRAEVAEEAPHL